MARAGRSATQYGDIVNIVRDLEAGDVINYRSKGGGEAYNVVVNSREIITEGAEGTLILVRLDYEPTGSGAILLITATDLRLGTIDDSYALANGHHLDFIEVVE